MAPGPLARVKKRFSKAANSSMTPAPALITTSTSWEPSSASGQHQKYVVGAYYPCWKIYKNRKPSDLRLSLLTHVYYAFARVGEDGTVYHRDIDADTKIVVDGTSGLLPALVKLKREAHPHLRIILSIGGGSGSSHFAGVAADKVKTARFCQTAKGMLEKFELDGVDIDWEHPKNAKEGASFAALLRSLREQLPSPQYTITAALPANEECLDHINLPDMLNGARPVVDHMNLMAYDLAGSWSATSGHHAQLHGPTKPKHNSAKQSIARMTQYLVQRRKVNPGRIILGIPVYGRSFLGVGGPGEKHNGCGGSEGTYEYSELPLNGSREITDPKQGAASCQACGVGRPEWVSYDNPGTVRSKCRFIEEQGLGGVFFWTGASDAVEDERSLVMAASQALNGVP